MSRPKYDWWGYVKSMIRRYPDDVTEDERRAVEAAIEATKGLDTGEDRLKVVELVLVKRTHSMTGAAQRLCVCERTAQRYHADFIRCVGEHFCCTGLCKKRRNT